MPAPKSPATAAHLLSLWHRLSSLPGGKRVFSLMLGRLVRYSGSVSPLVLELEPGFTRITMRDRHRLHNHLNSVHAIAIANVAELASGLAMTTALPPDCRGIVVRLNIEYRKKARGTLVAESRCVLPEISGTTNLDFLATVRDAADDTVAIAAVTWRLERAARTT